jgi:predicted kinase
MIIIFGGFSGSGKSYTARSISKKYNIPYINSDKVRKELANIGLTQKVFENFGKGLYSAKFTLKTYQELIKKTKQLLKFHENVIIDATFTNQEMQKLIITNFKNNYIFIFCYANDNIVKKRLEKRLLNKNSISDGRWEIYLRQKETFKGLIFPENKIIKIDTGKSNYLEDLLSQLNKYVKI